MRLTDHDDRMRLAFLALVGGLAAAIMVVALPLALRFQPSAERLASVPASAVVVPAEAGSSRAVRP